MKIIEMAKKAKEFVTEKIRKPKYKKGGLTDFAGNEVIVEKGELIMPIPKNMIPLTDMTAQNGQEDGEQEQTREDSHEDTKRQETPEMDVTVPENSDTYDQAIKSLSESIQTMADAIVKVGKTIADAVVKASNSPDMQLFIDKIRHMSMTEAQIRKEQLWRHYYEEKTKMSNNKRRMRGIPMVRRPKRQQYRVRKKKE